MSKEPLPKGPPCQRQEPPDIAVRLYWFHDRDGQPIAIRVEANLRKLAHDLVHKATRNKSKRTKLAHGAIVVKAVKQ